MKKIFLIFLFVLIFLIFLFSSYKNQININDLNSSNNSNITFCAKDAKLCDDGSVVGRVAPDCEFVKCPISNNLSKTKLQICPDSWYENKMPQIIELNQSIEKKEYFIINGKREEIVNYDLNWIKNNCKINSSQKI